MPTVAEMIDTAMRRKNLTQLRLAREAGITAPWINMIIRRGKDAGPETLLRIADVLGLDRGELVRQAHRERAYDEWVPYLEDNCPPAEKQEAACALPVIGTAKHGSAGEVSLAETAVQTNGGGQAHDAPGEYGPGARGAVGAIGFGPQCKAIRVEGEGLEPIAYDGQYVVISSDVDKDEIVDGSIVYVTYELPGHAGERAMIKRLYRYRLASEETDTPGLPVYNFVPVNTHLRLKGAGPEPEGAVTLRHRHVREMYPVVGVVFRTTG